MEDRAFHPGERAAWRKSGEWTWILRMRSRVAKKLDEQKRKLQRELRDIEKFSCVPKEFQENLKSNLQHQLQEVEQRRHDIMPEHQRAQTRLQDIQSIQDKRNFQKDSTAAEEEMRKLQEELKQKEERSFFCRTKFIRTRQQNFRKQVIAAWMPCGNGSSPWERIESRLCSKDTEKWEPPTCRCH